jgi:diguanylate cyclase (GGDEF)-like protein
MPIVVSEEHRKFLLQQVDQFHIDFVHQEINHIYGALRYQRPPLSIQSYLDEIERWRAAVHPQLQSAEDAPIDESFFPLLRTVLEARRRVVATDVDARRAKTLHPEAIATLNAELSDFDYFAGQDWFRSATPLPLPRLAEFLTLDEVERILTSRHVHLAEREYDEKFHLLQAPRLVLSDLAYYRDSSGVRGNPVALAFVDIDDFKRLNTKHGHHLVDQLVLPVFMRCLEAFAFARGFAYRNGGDEYVIILGNGQGALHALNELRNAVARLTFNSIPDQLTISIGVCIALPTSDLSDVALYERANTAMRFAKEHRKNCIATYMTECMRDSDLVIASPKESADGTT